MIIFDLDGTLADCEHRRFFLYQKKPNWKSFYEACYQDTPIKPVIEQFYRAVNFGEEVHIWSGRCESVRDKTIQWINEHIPGASHARLKMRTEGDYTPDEVLKERWLQETLKEGKKIKYVFDDRPKVVEMWRRNNIFVFNCLQSNKVF